MALAVAVAVVVGGGTSAPVAEAHTTASAPWLRVEMYYLKLLNCTRTGGWVRADGKCLGYGTGRYSKYVRPLKWSHGISDLVARPYAKLLAARNLCTHYADGDPGKRMRRAGYTGWAWGENIGCVNNSWSPYKAVLSNHLAFQREKSSNGGHWRILKSPRYTWVGIGVWGASGRIRLVIDFYRP